MDNVVRHPAAPAAAEQHTFTKAVLDYLPECLSIATERGGQYGDTWALENRVNTFKVVVMRLPRHPLLTGEWLRLMDCAALVDTKHSRWLGGVKRDTTIDSINYEAAFGYLMEDYQSKWNKLNEQQAAPKLPEAQ